MKKILSVLSFIILLLFLLSSCGETEKEKETSAGESKDVQITVGPGYTDNSEASLGKKEIKILAWKDAPLNEFENIGDTAGLYPEAVARRNKIVENRLDCKLVFSYESTGENSGELFIKRAENEAETEIFAAHNRVMPLLAIKGVLEDLTLLENAKGLDLSKPWWPSDIKDTLSFDGKLYFATGDISVNYINSLGVVFYNKTLTDMKKIDSDELFSAALGNGWTLEAMENYTKKCYVNRNGENTYGFALGPNGEYADFFFKASGFSSVTVKEGKTELRINETTAEYENSSFRAVREFFAAKENSVSWNNTQAGRKLFTDGKAAFTVSPLSFAKELSGKIEYGILPIPKYNEKDTISVPLQNGYTFYGVSSAVSKENQTSAGTVLQSLGASSANIVLPAYVKDCLGVEYNTVNLNVYVVDLLKKKAYFDVLDVFFPSVAPKDATVKEGPAYIFRNEILSYTDTISSSIAYRAALLRNVSQYENALNDLRKKFDTLN